MDSEALKTEIDEVQKTPIVFILGCPRSGTTLLQSSLNAHPNIIAPPESQFINLFYPRFGKIKHMNADSISEFVNTLFCEPLFSNLWLLNKAQIEEKLASVAEYLDYPLLCKMLFYQMRENKEKVLLICDKNPRYSLFAKKLLKIFPEARFIHIIRDPRDNVNSNIKRLNKKNTFFLARQWLGFNICIENMKRRFPNKFFTIIYEDMVRNPENTFIPLCEYLAVPYNDAMLNHQFPERLQMYEGQKAYKRAKTAHQNLLQPINTSNIGKWKNEMSEPDRTITEIITAKFANKYYRYNIEPYQKNSPKISPVRLFKSWIQYTLWQFFTRMRFKNYAFNKWYYINKKKF